MSSIRIFVALMLVILFQEPAAAQEPWTLTGCIEYAFQNNIKLKQQALGVDVARNNLNQSKLNLLPSVNSGMSQ